ncbi:uncharacterized protein PAF06_001534 [Gastrophryne carolinensis]
MVQARKKTSSAIYYRVWRAYIDWCESRSLPCREFLVSRVLEFLQHGLDLGLKLSTLKGQVSALSIFFQKTFAQHSLIKTFFQGVTHVRPPRKPMVPVWDLNLVLSALQGPPFEPIHEAALAVLTLKVVFLVAITSVRRVSELAALSIQPPYFERHRDKVVFRFKPDFLPKVVSAFHLNQDIVLPSLCPNPSNPKERVLHSLDVVRCVKSYLVTTQAFRKMDALFVVPHGPRKGLAPAKSTISKWIRQAVVQAYTTKGKTPPFRLNAHSTRAVGASWAFQHQASVEQVCKAATWSSVHTFTKFYKVDVKASADAVFGRKVLQAAVV